MILTTTASSIGRLRWRHNWRQRYGRGESRIGVVVTAWLAALCRFRPARAGSDAVQGDNRRYQPGYVAVLYAKMSVKRRTLPRSPRATRSSFVVRVRGP